MTKVYKEVKIYVCDSEQSVTLVNNESDNGIIMKFKEENDAKTFYDCYLTPEQANQIGKELISFSEYMESKN